MNVVLHKANSRGHADHGWLESYHSFSFAGYYDPDRMNFGMLRVLNDDRVAHGRGFGEHAHDNMEIISIPLEGDLEHKDSMGNATVIRAGDVQAMSAGTGIRHSEYNKNPDTEVRFLQIWLVPREQDVEPRYDQITASLVPNQLKQVLSPDPDDEGVWIHQDAWFYLGEFEAATTVTHKVKREANGLYLFVLEGEVEAARHSLERRDAVGISDTQAVEIAFSAGSSVLLMDVPLA